MKVSILGKRRNNMKYLKKMFPALAVFLIAVSLIGCAVSPGGGGGGENSDKTAPTVSSTIPANDAVDAAINANITATFSEKMNPSTINATTFTLMQGTTPVSGAVTYVGTVATFSPASDRCRYSIYRGDNNRRQGPCRQLPGQQQAMELYNRVDGGHHSSRREFHNPRRRGHRYDH